MPQSNQDVLKMLSQLLQSGVHGPMTPGTPPPKKDKGGGMDPMSMLQPGGDPLSSMLGMGGGK